MSSGVPSSSANMRTLGRRRAMLSMNGRDMQSLGLSGCAVGQALEALLEHVIEFPDDNSRERLMPLAERLKNTH